MPRGDKSSYTGKQKRQAQHIEEGYEQRGVPANEAERRAWATVNKETGGGKSSYTEQQTATPPAALAFRQEGGGTSCEPQAERRVECAPTGSKSAYYPGLPCAPARTELRHSQDAA